MFPFDMSELAVRHRRAPARIRGADNGVNAMEVTQTELAPTGRLAAGAAVFATAVSVMAAVVLLSPKVWGQGGVLFFGPFSFFGAFFGAILGGVGWWDSRRRGGWPRTIGRACLTISLALLVSWSVLFGISL